MDDMRDSSTSSLPEGTVTLLFTDIEGLAQLLHRLSQVYVTLPADYHRLLRDVYAKWRGREGNTEGEAFFVSFPRASVAVNTVVKAQRALFGRACQARKV